MRKYLLVLVMFFAPVLHADVVKSHAIALYGDPKYPADFPHFDYVNPDAPKGGDVRLMAHGTFDTLNPYTLKGISPSGTAGFYMYGISELSDTLMVSSYGDEPDTVYGLIAESIEYPEDRSWAIFHINPRAQFHDGSKITPEDVAFSLQLIKDKAHPVYAQAYQNVSEVEVLDSNRVKFTFSGDDNRSLIMRAAQLPVLSKAYWQQHEFERTTLEPPLNNGPYKISEVKAGQSITFSRVNDYWAKDLPVNRGRYNYETVTYDFYRDLPVGFEGFKSNSLDVFIEYISSNWKNGYDFPAIASGDVLKLEIPHNLPAPFQVFVYNTRRDIFNDVRVREALSLMFDFEWLNKSIFNNAYTRSRSYYSNTELSSSDYPVSQQEIELLSKYADESELETFIKPFNVSKTNGDGNIRSLRREALALLKQAGWQIKNGVLVNDQTKKIFEFEILNDQASLEKIILPFIKNLKSIGVNASLRTIDASQYKSRLDAFDYDMIIYSFAGVLSPGQEQKEYFHSSYSNVNGSRNYAGINHPVVDELVELLLASETREELVTRTRALDRVLLSQYYVIPQYHSSNFRVAYWNKFERPEIIPPYWLGFENWWINNENMEQLNEK